MKKPTKIQASAIIFDANAIFLFVCFSIKIPAEIQASPYTGKKYLGNPVFVGNAFTRLTIHINPIPKRRVSLLNRANFGSLFFSSNAGNRKSAAGE